MSAMKESNLINLYKAGQSSTMVSSRPALALNNSEYPDLSNIRNRYGILEVRKPDAALAQTGLPGGAVFYAGGSWSGTIAGVEYALVAVKNGTAVDIYDSPDGTTWTNRSSTTVKAYGITQLTDATASANGISMQAINDPIVGESVIISDGTTVLFWNATTVNFERLKKVTSIASSYKGRPQPVMYQTPSSSISGVINNAFLARTGTTFSATSGNAGTIAIAAAQNFGDTLEVTLTGGFTAQFQLGFFCTIPSIPYDFFSACKLEIAQSGGGAYVTIYDPSASSVGAPSIETYANIKINGVTQQGMWVTYPTQDVFTNSIVKMRLTYKGTAAQFAAGTIQLYVIGSGSALTGSCPAGYQNYAIAYRSSGTGVETSLKVLDSSVQVGDLIWQYYNPAGTTPDPVSRFPISSYFRGVWQVVDVSPPVASNFDQFCLYRKDAGSSSYFFVGSTTYTTWAAGSPGSWSSVALSALYLDGTDTNSLNYERPAPSSYNIAPPGFRCALNLNDRLFIGTVNEYRFSEFKWPMRHGLAVDVLNTDRSSGGFRFKSETPKSFFYVIGDTRYDHGTDKGGIVTDRTVRMITGLDTFSLMRPTKISEFGTNSPKSFIARRESTYWVDDNRRFHSHPIQQGIDNRSLDIKDILDGISTTNIKNVTSATFDDRIYFFYTPSGQSVNNAAIVYDLISGSLTRDTYTLGVVSAMVNASRFIAFMSDGTMRTLESSTPATVTGVSVVSKEIGTVGESFSTQRQRIYCDSAAATTATLTWTPFKVGTAAIITDTMSLAANVGEDRTDRMSNLGKGVKGRSIKMAFSGNIPSGTKFYAWQVEQEGRIQEADVT